MSSRLRFMTARQVFEAFEEAAEDIEAPPTDDPPLDFMRGLLVSGAVDDALAFGAYLLPRREAVWWACQCLRAMDQVRTDAAGSAVEAAEGWVRHPGEENRRAALDLAMKLPPREAATWLAFAAGWSGGSMVAPEFERVPPAPHLTARAVRSALLLGLAAVDQPRRPHWASRCAESCIRFADGGAADV